MADRLRFHPSLAADLRDAVAWYDGISPDLGSRFRSHVNGLLLFLLPRPRKDWHPVDPSVTLARREGGQIHMTRNELIEMLTARPFRPIRMYVSDGATYLIRHPDLVLVSPMSAYVGVAEGDQPGPAVERMTIVDLGHITRVEQLEQPAASDNSS